MTASDQGKSKTLLFACAMTCLVAVGRSTILLWWVTTPFLLIS